MDPLLEYQRHLLFTSFAYWGVALILAGSMRVLVRNAEKWKARLLRILSLEHSEQFAEQATLALDFGPASANSQRPAFQQRTRNLKNDVGLILGRSGLSNSPDQQVLFRSGLLKRESLSSR